MRTIAIVILALLVGCTTLDVEKNGNTRMTARGDSQASDEHCKIRTVVTAPDGTVTETCTESRSRVATGGQGGTDMYKTIGTIAGLVLSGVSIAIQALR